jgi:hypothetical protein
MAVLYAPYRIICKDPSFCSSCNLHAGLRQLFLFVFEVLKLHGIQSEPDNSRNISSRQSILHLHLVDYIHTFYLSVSGYTGLQSFKGE